MFRNRFVFIAVLVTLFAGQVIAQRGHSSGRVSGVYSTGKTPAVKHESSNKCESCVRDSQGRIARSTKAKDDFKRTHPCPGGNCEGLVIDHIIPLAKGGKDDPSNMQWQTKAAAKAKDKVERKP